MSEQSLSSSVSIEELHKEFLDLEHEYAMRMARTRHLLALAANEVRVARGEVARQRVHIFTEAELADELKISEDTLQRLRLADPDFPHMKIGSLVRYSNLHLAEICARMDVRAAFDRMAEKRKRAA